ncbi:MAG: hypothetical protein HQ549_03010 [Candidatus Omnitrophica bacterium]|nr:hypothetical protein [Candidatus Omnitrophota bacterium]
MPATVDIRNQFKTFVANRGGLYFKDHDLKNLESAISARMKSRGMHSFPGYYAYLTTAEEKEDEFRELLNLLTINHTYFFRNEPQFKALREKVLPNVIEKKRQEASASGEEKPALRIWSAGCATGQEPYSIAMIVRDLIEDIDDWDVQILATDASENALQNARKGTYSQNSVKHVDETRLARYFTKEGNTERDTKYRIQENIRRMINFAFFNLMEESFPTGFDIIFCRNVVIYFEFETTVKVMNKLYSGLLDGGYMFIGYSETLQFMQDRLQMISWEDAIYYHKAKGKAPVYTEFAEPLPAKEEIDLDKVLEEISKAEATANLEAETKKAPPTQKIENMLIQIIKAMHLKQYDKALSLIEEASSVDDKVVDPHYLAAEIFINQGKRGEAKTRLSTALKLDSLFAPAHYLYGCIYVEESDLDNAKKSLKKALFIDKNFLLAHFYLAQVFKTEGRTKDAIREYRNSLKLLSGAAPGDIIAYSGGFNAATFMSVCRDNLERLKIEYGD